MQPSAWIKNNNIPFREQTQVTNKFMPYEIGFELTIHIKYLERLLMLFDDEGDLRQTNRFLWNPLQHEPTKILAWGEYRTRGPADYHVYIYADKSGPQLPHMSYAQSCVNLAQWGQLDTLENYKHVCAALSMLHSKITIGEIYTPFNTWPEEVQKAIPIPIRNLITNTDNPNHRAGLNNLKPDRTEIVRSEETWEITHMPSPRPQP